MKKNNFLILITALLFSLNQAQSQQGWFWQNPLPQGNTLLSFHSINASTGWAVGEFGTILKTTNGGTNWTILSSGTTTDLNSVYFINANTGTAVGLMGTVLRTTNGGINWTAQFLPTERDLHSVFFS